MGFYGDLMGFQWDVPSGNDCYIANWKDPPCFHGKTHELSMAMASTAMLFLPEGMSWDI